MNLLVVGISHRSAAVETLERLAVGPEAAADLARSLLRGGEVREAVVLSTCNRVEVYATAGTFHGGLSAIVDELHRVWGLNESEASLDFASCGYVRHGADAAAHAFRVAAGLDSMVAGEPQILGQLRDAYETAREADQVGRHLHELFQQALARGQADPRGDRRRRRRALRRHRRPRTRRARARPRRFRERAHRGPRRRRRRRRPWAASPPRPSPAAGVATLHVANRDRDKAERLAAAWGAETADYDDLTSLAAQVDLLVCATASPEPVLRAAHLAGRRGPIVVCDLALPKDVAEEVALLEGVHVVDIAEIQRSNAAGAASETLAEVEALLAEEIAAYNESLRADAVTPTVAALRATAADIVEAELSRVARRGDFTDDQRAEVARTVHRVVQRLLHEPTVRVRELAGQPGAPDYARALRDLFALEAAAVAQPQGGDLAEALKVSPALVDPVAGADTAPNAGDALAAAPEPPGAPSPRRP